MMGSCFIGNCIQIGSFFLSGKTSGWCINYPLPPPHHRTKQRAWIEKPFPSSQAAAARTPRSSAWKEGKALCISASYRSCLHQSLAIELMETALKNGALKHSRRWDKRLSATGIKNPESKKDQAEGEDRCIQTKLRQRHLPPAGPMSQWQGLKVSSDSTACKL